MLPLLILVVVAEMLGIWNGTLLVTVRFPGVTTAEPSWTAAAATWAAKSSRTTATAKPAGSAATIAATRLA